MSRLDGFCDKDFLEQILLLDTLCSEAPVEELSGLQQFFEQPTGDTAIDSMVVNALNGILAAHPDSAIAGLHSEKDGFRTLCIRVIGESRLIDGVPALMERITQASLPDEQLDILSALARIKDPQSLPVFQQFLENDDDLIAAMSIETCGRFGDEASIPFLLKIIRQGEAEGQFEQCDIRTWKAIRALGSIGSDEAMFSLTQVLHHKNPTARRIITDTMIEAGEKSVPFLLHTFAEDNTDQRILVANLLGFIKAKTGADGLVEAYDRGLAADPNVRYALYEALGRIGTMKGLICLMDGLAETNDLILMAVIGGLEQQMNPGLVQGVAKTLKQGDAQSRRVARALIASKATSLFTRLYPDEHVANLLITTLTAVHDTEVVATFKNALSEIKGSPERIQSDIARLPRLTSATKTALVADDSKSMLALQRAILADLGYKSSLAADGAQALALAEERTFDMVITDMNMPNMDGMELIQHLRDMREYQQTPIIMVTTESEASQKNLAAAFGVTAFITKPFKPEDLKKIILESA